MWADWNLGLGCCKTICDASPRNPTIDSLSTAKDFAAIPAAISPPSQVLHELCQLQLLFFHAEVQDEVCWDTNFFQQKYENCYEVKFDFKPKPGVRCNVPISNWGYYDPLPHLPLDLLTQQVHMAWLGHGKVPFLLLKDQHKIQQMRNYLTIAQ